MELPLDVPGPPPRRRIWPIALALFLILALIVALLLVGRSRAGGGPDRGAPDLARLSAETEAIRELRFERPVNPEYLTSEELEREIRDAVAEGELVTGLPDAEVLDALGVIPEADDLTRILTEASASGVIGFYDPETSRLVVESSAGKDISPLAQTTLVHELTHAVTDQHFDLGAFLTGEEPADELNARTAVAEGDATLTMNLWQARNLSLTEQLEVGFEAAGDVGSQEQLEAIPPALTEMMIAPYVDGLAFVRSLYESGGWTAVNEAYRRPPLTTEQVLHPEVYAAGDTGETVPPPPPPPGNTQGATGQIGELFLRAMLSGGAGSIPFLGADREAAEAAAGWDGGAYAVSSGPGGLLVTLDVRWDSAADAEAFARELLEAGAADSSATGWACLRVERPQSRQTLVRVHETSCPSR